MLRTACQIHIGAFLVVRELHLDHGGFIFPPPRKSPRWSSNGPTKFQSSKYGMRQTERFVLTIMLMIIGANLVAIMGAPRLNAFCLSTLEITKTWKLLRISMNTSITSRLMKNSHEIEC